MAAGVLHDLVVDLVLVPGQRVLGREDSAALAAVKLGRLLVDGLNVSFQGLGVTVNLDKHVLNSKLSDDLHSFTLLQARHSCLILFSA